MLFKNTGLIFTTIVLFICLSCQDILERSQKIVPSKNPFGLIVSNFKTTAKIPASESQMDSSQLSAFALARDKWDKGELDSAIEILQGQFRSGKKNEQMYLQLIQYMQESPSQKNQKEVDFLYQSALKMYPNHPVLLNNYGWFKIKNGDNESAREIFERVTKITTSFPSAYEGLSKIYSFQFMAPEAIHKIRLAIGYSMDTSLAPYDELIKLYYIVGNSDSLSEVLEYVKSIKQFSDTWEFYNALILEEKGRVDSAAGIYLNLFLKDKFRPEYRWALSYLGEKSKEHRRLLFKNKEINKKEISQSVGIFQSLISENPRRGLLWFGLSKAYLLNGDLIKAYLALDSALKLKSDIKNARELQLQIFKRWDTRDAKINDQYDLPVPNGLDGKEKPAAPAGVLDYKNYGDPLDLIAPFSFVSKVTKNDVLKTFKHFIYQNEGKKNLKTSIVIDSLKVDQVLGFERDSLWGVRVFFTDVNKGPRDLFGDWIGRFTDVLGRGQSTGMSYCDGYKPFQGVLWELENEVAMLAQFSEKNWELRGFRVDRNRFSKNAKLCDMMKYLDTNYW